MKFILTFLLITFSISINSQTTIVVRKEKDQIVAIADTRMSYLNSSKKDTIEKLGCENKICFAVGGIFFKENYKLASDCCKGAKTFQEAVDSFVSKALIQVSKQYDTLKQKYLDYYTSHMYKVTSFVIFFGYEKRQYKAKPITFLLPQTIGNNGSAVAALYMSYGGACDYDTITYTFGHLNAIRDSVCLDATWRPNPEETAIRMMRKQINDKQSQQFVGAPMTLITIKRKKIVKRTVNE